MASLRSGEQTWGHFQFMAKPEWLTRVFQKMLKPHLTPKTSIFTIWSYLCKHKVVRMQCWGGGGGVESVFCLPRSKRGYSMHTSGFSGRVSSISFPLPPNQRGTKGELQIVPASSWDCPFHVGWGTWQELLAEQMGMWTSGRLVFFFQSSSLIVSQGWAWNLKGCGGETWWK